MIEGAGGDEGGAEIVSHERERERERESMNKKVLGIVT